MLYMPVPGRPSDLKPKELRPCESMLYTNWVKIEEVQSKISLHSALNVDQK